MAEATLVPLSSSALDAAVAVWAQILDGHPAGELTAAEWSERRRWIAEILAAYLAALDAAAGCLPEDEKGGDDG